MKTVAHDEIQNQMFRNWRLKVPESQYADISLNVLRGVTGPIDEYVQAIKVSLEWAAVQELKAVK